MATGAKNKAEPQQAPKPVREKQQPELRVTGALAWAPCAGSARTALHTRLYLRGWLAAWGLAGQRAGDPGGRGRVAGVQRLRGWGLPPWGLAPLCPVSPTDWMSPHAAEDAPLRPVCRLKREPQAQSGRALGRHPDTARPASHCLGS